MKKVLSSLLLKNTLQVGILDCYRLIEKTINLSSVIKASADNPVESLIYTPNHCYENVDNLYFASAELAKTDNRSNFLAILGNKWLGNDSDAIFVEALVFGNHKISNIDCILGSVQVFRNYKTPRYFAPGTVALLEKVEFKNTTYFTLKEWLTDFYINDGNDGVWEIDESFPTYYHDKEYDEYI